MKSIFCAVALIVLFATSNVLSLDELPEPINPDTIFTAEICWGTVTGNSTWIAIPITTNIISETISGTHNYLSKLGPQSWESSITVDPINPLKLLLVFNITEDMIPNDGYNYHFYRLRVNGRLVVDGKVTDIQATSSISNWVVIYRLSSSGKPIKK